MLNVNKSSVEAKQDSPLNRIPLAEVFQTYFNIIRRQLPIFFGIVCGCMMLGLLYLLMTPSSYTATATMIIDARKIQLFGQQSIQGDVPVDAIEMQTQIAVLKSKDISLAVIKKLRLADDPEFNSSGMGALGAFESHRSVNRAGFTYVIEVSFVSHDSDKAARIANAIVEAYIADLLEAKYQATQQAGIWLQDRIKELGHEATSADRAVVDFKRSNNIVDVEGKSMGELQLAEINNQLIMAHAATAEAKARLDTISKIMQEEVPDAAVTDALKSEVIVKLRQQYLELASREAIWSAKYGPNHRAVVDLRKQMLELRHNISNEMQKIAQSFHSDYEIALARENAIKSSLAQSLSEKQTTNQARVQLHELESNAQTYRSTYHNFLQQYTEAIQQGSFPITEARLIGPATRPLQRSQPKTLVVLSVTTVTALMLGFGVALLRNITDRAFRTSTQVEDMLQLPCLAMLPLVKLDPIVVEPFQGSERSTRSRNVPIPSAMLWYAKDFLYSRFAEVLRSVKVAVDHSSVAKLNRVIGITSPLPDSERPTRSPNVPIPSAMFWYALDFPFSQFAEALRSVKVAIDLSNGVKLNCVIGITSTLPNEGKSTTSCNFAHLLALGGNRVLLVDADLRSPTLSRNMAPSGESGLIDVLAGRKTLNEVILMDPTSGLRFLPAGEINELMHTNEILGSQKLKNLIENLRKSYHYIIIDLAPLAPVVDTRTTTSYIDSYVFVVEWGETNIDAVGNHLADAQEVYDRVLGVVINKTDMTKIGYYQSYRSDHYYKKYHKPYGYIS